MLRILQAIYFANYRYKRIYNQIWKAVTDLEIKLLGENIPTLPDVEYIKYSEKLQKPISLHYRYLESTMVRFFNSKPIQGCVYGEQLMLISGPEKIGKSTFIRESLQLFRKMKKIKRKVQPIKTRESIPPKVYDIDEQRKIYDDSQCLVISLQMGQHKNLSFHAFIDMFERRLTQEIVNTHNSFKQRKKVLLTENVLLKLALIQYHHQYLRTYAKDALHSILNDCSEALYSDSFKGKLSKCRMLRTSKIEFSQQNLETQLHQLIALFQQNSNCTQIEAALQLYLLTFKQIQYEHRPPQYTSSYYRTGIQTSSFLLSILDYFIGTVELHKGLYIRPKAEKDTNEFLKGFAKINTEDEEYYLYEQEKEIKLSRKSPLKSLPIPTTCIEAGQHIDAVIALIDLFEMSCSRDKQFLDWYDYVVARSNTRSAMRKGVPIIMELHPSTFNQDIYNLGGLPPDNPLLIDLAGYRAYKQKQSIFHLNIESPEFYKIWYTLGHHPDVWRDVILEIEGKGKYLQDAPKEIKNLQITKKDMIVANSLINRAFTHPRAVEMMHLSSYRFRVAQLLKEFKKKKLICLEDLGVRVHYLQDNPVMGILIECGLLSCPFYEDRIHPTRFTYLHAFPEAIKSLKENRGRFQYLKWFLENGYYFSQMKTKVYYELEVKRALIDPRHQISQYYSSVPRVNYMNKVAEQSYIPKEDVDFPYHTHYRTFYNI